MSYTLSNKKNKIISASLFVLLVVIVSGCNGKTIDTNKPLTESINSNVTEKTDNAELSIESSSINDSEVAEFKPTATDCSDFMKYYIDKLGIEEENNSASVSQLSCFLYDENMNKAFIDFYNEKYGTSFTTISRLKLIEF